MGMQKQINRYETQTLQLLRKTFFSKYIAVGYRRKMR